MSGIKPEPLLVNGWTVFAHPLFLRQLESLTRQVETLKKKDPIGYARKNASKRLTAILKLAFEVIPQDPARPEFRQGGTLGSDYKHWFRAKFFQQYRLFFRYHAQSRVIVLAWVNDDDIPHTVVSGTNLFKSKVLDTGDRFSFTFTRAGAYGYFCSLHPHMTGKVLVSA